MAIDTIIFDLGGVLIDWDPRYLYRKIFSGREEEMEWFLSNVCHPEWNAQQDAGRTFEEAIDKKVREFPQFRSEIEAFYHRWSEMLGGVIPDSVQALKNSREQDKLKLYALTNWSHQTFPIARMQFDFLKWFDGIVVSGEEKLKKPDPEIYRVLIKRFNIVPERALFIDDTFLNIESAKKLGFKTIHFKQPVNLWSEIQLIIGGSV